MGSSWLQQYLVVIELLIGMAGAEPKRLKLHYASPHGSERLSPFRISPILDVGLQSFTISFAVRESDF